MPRIDFASPEKFRNLINGYTFLPFQFMRWHDSKILLVNDVGEYIYLDDETFKSFISHNLNSNNPYYLHLKTKHFLLDSRSTLPIQLLTTKYRTKRNYLRGFTKLHLFIVTLRCNHACTYCAVSSVEKDKYQFDMSKETAHKAVETMFRSPSDDLKVEFQGGEPLLNFDVVKQIYDQTEIRNETAKRRIEYVICTNLADLSDEAIRYMKDTSMMVSTSLDGPAFIHNANRRYLSGNSHEITVRNINRVQDAIGKDRVSALMTTTDISIKHPREIIDEYVRLGFNSIFIRPIRPYGRACRKASGEATYFL
jgi:uncharacterized protein